MKSYYSALTLISVVLWTSPAHAGNASLGNATSSASFEIRGNVVNVAGVPSWPLLAGDTVSALATPVSLTFKDGSRITLTPNSKARIGNSATTTVDILAGSADLYLVRQTSGVTVLNNGQPVDATASTVRTTAGSSKTASALKVTPPPPPTPISGR